jgi:hypothetical protein
MNLDDTNWDKELFIQEEESACLGCLSFLNDGGDINIVIDTMNPFIQSDKFAIVAGLKRCLIEFLMDDNNAIIVLNHKNRFDNYDEDDEDAMDNIDDSIDPEDY